jgi:hypothetical protein
MQVAVLGQSQDAGSGGGRGGGGGGGGCVWGGSFSWQVTQREIHKNQALYHHA